jgi:hypothetical protein
VNDHVYKIKQTLRQLGFSLSIVESLTDLYFHYSTENEHFKHSKYIISDSSNIKIFELELYEYNDYNTISLKFEQQQEILKRINLTTYDKKNLYRYCTLYFDKKYDFLHLSISDGLEIITDKLKYSFDIFIWFDFDINLDLQRIKVSGYTHSGTVLLFDINKSKETFLPIEDELLLIEFLQYQYNDDIVSYVPEFYIPSAYTFNSDEFNIRISLAKMMII